jgi:hypothetical protein
LRVTRPSRKTEHTKGEYRLPAHSTEQDQCRSLAGRQCPRDLLHAQNPSRAAEQVPAHCVDQKKHDHSFSSRVSEMKRQPVWRPYLSKNRHHPTPLWFFDHSNVLRVSGRRTTWTICAPGAGLANPSGWRNIMRPPMGRMGFPASREKPSRRNNTFRRRRSPR